jgi:hypothetical protein
MAGAGRFDRFVQARERADVNHLFRSSFLPLLYGDEF